MIVSTKIFNSKVMILRLMIIIFSLCVCLYPRISSNGSGGGYDSPGDGQGLAAYSTIENLVVEGAGYYLQGNSFIQSFLNQVELQDITGSDYTELQRLIAGAVESISNARAAYEKLVETAEMTPYNPVFIDRLKTFAYDSFMLDNRLNEMIFKKVKGYFSNGDITGALKHNLFLIKSIQLLLFTVKNDVEFNHMPGLEISWKLNELCAEFSLFGSYAARIFQSIKQK